MDKAVKDTLTAGGINVDEALERFLDNEALMHRFLKKFLDDPNYGKLTLAMETGDREAAFTAAHTLKGVCGNLSLVTLYALLTRQVECLRADDWAGASALMPDLSLAYEQASAAIQTACP